MNLRAAFGALVLAASVPGGASPARAAPAPAEVPAAPAAARDPLAILGRLPTLEQVSLSPDGSRLAFVRTAGEERVVGVTSIADRSTLAGFRIGDTKLRDVRWAESEHLLLTGSQTYAVEGLAGPRREWWMLQLCTVQGRCRPVDFDARGVKTMNVVLGPPSTRTIDGRTRVYVAGLHIPRGVTTPALFEVDPATARARIAERGTVELVDWLLDARGDVAAQVLYRERDRGYALQVRGSDGRVREVGTGLAPTALETPRLLGFGADPDTVLVAVEEDDGRRIRAASRRDGTWSELADPRVAGGRPLVDPATGRVIGTAERSGAHRFVDAETQRRWDSIARAFGDSRLELVSWSRSFDRFVVRVEHPDRGYEFRLVDWATKRADPIGDVYAGLGPHARRERLVYRAADGLEIPAFLTLPRGREARALPLIVLSNVGPPEVGTDAFDWWSQAYAALGYAVLQADVRGSAVGSAHLRAGFGEWGRRMQTDLSDGVRHLAAAGTADPARVCIVGASYGGYAALAGVTLQSGVYRCAVAVAGLADPGGFVRWVNLKRGLGDRRAIRWWERYFGASGADDPLLERLSPVARAANGTAPVLLVHGRDDTVVPYAQAEDMARALRAAGRPVEFVTLVREDHWLSRSATREQMLRASADFLARHNPP